MLFTIISIHSQISSAVTVQIYTPPANHDRTKCVHLFLERLVYVFGPLIPSAKNWSDFISVLTKIYDVLETPECKEKGATEATSGIEKSI